MYDIWFSCSVEGELKKLRTYDQRVILKEIEKQLTHQPERGTKKKKLLEDLGPPDDWDAVPPMWQLRIGDFRVFYDVDLGNKRVHVRAIRKKPPHKTTEEIL
jgi:mRNA-degrading endonuclease RelE of RelBE toxin-antitoxin system